MSNNLFEGTGYEGDYKPLMPEYYPPQYKKYIDEEIELLKIKLKGADNILEAGVGIGRLIRHISPIVGKLIGIDNSDYMIKKATEVASGFGNVEIKKLDLEKISEKYPQGFFDYSLVMWNTLGNVSDEVLFLKSLAEVTKKEIIITVHKKGTLPQRRNWYKTVGIEVEKVDEDSETVYTDSGLRSKAYNLEDIQILAEKVNLKIENSKVLSDVVLWVELAKN